MRNRPQDTNVETAEEQVGEGWAARLDALVGSDAFRVTSGILLMLLSIYLFISCASYFWCCAVDQTFSESLTPDTLHQVHNWGGALGNWVGTKLVHEGFGIPVLVLIVAMFLVSLRMVGAYKSLPLWRLFFHSAFWLIWTAIFIDFVCLETIGKLFSLDPAFLWGGAYGQAMDSLLDGYLGNIGTAIMMLATLLIYLVIVSERTIPTLKHWGSWFKEKMTGANESETILTNEADIAPEAEETSDDEFFIEDEPTDEPEESAAQDEPLQPDEPDTIEFLDDPSETPEPNETSETPKTQGMPDSSSEDDFFSRPDWIPATEATATSAATVASVATPVQVEEGFTVAPGQDEMVDDDTPTGEPAPQVEESQAVRSSEDLLAALGPYDPRADLSHYEFPPLSLLKTYPNENSPVIDMEEQQANKNRIVQTLRDYGIEIEKIMATVGPTITLYEIVPKAGTRINKIRTLSDDIMLSLKAKGIRIIAPIPGKGTVGIEVPNENPQIVSMHSVIASKKFQEERKMALPVALGRTITNEVYMFDLAKTPHLLVAGATGQGKSVGLNAIITSLLYKKHPSELKFVLVDPKMVEFNIYAVLEKHYIAKLPEEDKVIITESDKVINTLNSLVVEMENRYKLLMEANCRNIKEYNEKFINRQLNPEKGHRFMPYIVIIIDEFGDFIMVAGKDVETPIARITQKARAVGMHMILATQRPSVNIITGVIKANVPARMAFRCSSMIDSRTVLDEPGAQQLVGKGDLLYKGGSDCDRVQCAFVDTPEVQEIVDYISQQQAYPEAYPLPDAPDPESDGGLSKPGAVDLSKRDPLFTDAARFVVANQQGSTSILQRRFEIGYNRAGKLSDQLEAAGIVGPNNGPKGRPVLVDEFQLEQILQGLLHT